MPAQDAMRLIGQELVLDGDPQRNLATFVTTWMEPEAQRIIAESLHRNFIDHAEYPRTAEIEQRCIRMLADLFHAPGETTGARTQGSSEAIMLGALALKWKWRKRREADGKPTDRPNLVFGGDVHVVWEKFCRYFDVEPRIVPLQEGKYTIGPDDVEPHVDENTIGVAAVLGTTFTGHSDDIVGINDYLVRLKHDKGVDVPLHVDGASGAFVWPFLYPHSEWDFRLEQVRSINASGHKFGLVYPGIGWIIFRERSDLPEELVFTENYLGKTDETFTLNFSTGSAMVLAQYYNFVRFGHDGYALHHGDDAAQQPLPRGADRGDGRVRADRDRRGAAAAGGVQARRGAQLRRVRRRRAACGRARLDGARIHTSPECREREDHACAGEGNPQSRPCRHPRGRHRRGVRHAEAEGRPARVRAPARQVRHRLLIDVDILFFRLTRFELGLLFFAVILGATGLGVFLGHRVRHLSESLREPFGVLQGALLGVVGLLLAFGLSLAVSRYEDRRANIVSEAKAIDKTYLRAQTLAEPVRSRSLDLLVGYTRSAIRLSDEVPGSAEADDARAQEERIERRLWNLAGEALERARTASAPRLYVEALNEMIDGETARVAALSNRVPTAVLVLEVLGAALALGLLAAYLAIVGRGVLAVLLASGLVAFLLLVTADLDRPTRGMIQVPDAALRNELTSMTQPPAAAAPRAPTR